MERKYNAIKAGWWYVIGNMLVKCIPFFSLPIFTRLLTTEDFGVFNTYLSYEGIFSIVLMLGLSGSVKMAKFEFGDSFDDYISSVNTVVLFIGAILVFVIFIFSKYLNGLFGNHVNLLFILLFHCIGLAIYNILSCKYVINGEYIKNLLCAIAMTGLNIGLSILLCFVGFYNQRYKARIIGTAASVIIVALVICISQYRSSIKVKRKYIKFGLLYGVPLIPHYLSMTILSQVDKLMIQKMVGNSAAGIYSLGVNIMTVMTVILGAVDNAWAPWYYMSLNVKKFKEIKKYNNLLAAGFSFLVCGFLLITPELVLLLSTREYYDSIYSIIPLVISVYVNFMYLFAVNLEYFHKKSWYISFSTVIAALVNIILNFIFILFFGYIGAAYATCLSKFILFVLHWKKAKMIEKDEVVSGKILLLFLFICCGCGWFTLFTIERLFLRYTVIVFVIIIGIIAAYKNRKLIKERLSN